MFTKTLDILTHRVNWALVLAVVFGGAALVVTEVFAFSLLQVALYKGFLLFAAAHAGYWIDRVLFPYARPDCVPVVNEAVDESELVAQFEYPHDLSFMAWCMLRRALIVVGTMVCVAFGA